MAKSIKTRLREIVESRSVTDAQKQWIEEQSAVLGVPFVRRYCVNCYIDQAIILWRVVSEKEARKAKRAYILRGGIDVFWRGVRVNMTLSDDELKKLLADGFPKSYFCRIDSEDGLWL